MDKNVRLIEESLLRVEKWVERHGYKAYEPFDGLSSSFQSLTFGNLFLDRILMQLIRQSPVNLRPLLGVKPLESTKGRGYMAWGYLDRFKATGDESYKKRAFACLDWLDKNKSPKYQDHSWANHFAFASRGGRYSEHESIIVWTALIGFAYLEAFEMFGEKRHKEIIESITRWIMALSREKTESGTCISYVMTGQSSIHNSNMLGSAFLANAAKLIGNKDASALAREAMVYSCTRQLPDGSWWYAEDPKYHWIDNFHTGYNLSSLKRYIDVTGDKTWFPQLTKGLQFFKENFFEPSGRPKYYHSRTYPVDSQCAGQAVETLAHFSDIDPSCLELSLKVAAWWIANMQAKDGHFYYRQYPLNIKAKAPMLHWAQATVYKGLSALLLKLQQPKSVL
jgi:hypothetical protein